MEEQENYQSQENAKVPVRDASVVVWGPIYVTLNLEKTSNAQPNPPVEPHQQNVEETKPLDETPKNKEEKKTVNIISSTTENQPVQEPKQDNSKKVTYIYNLVDHGLDCECIDIKGELLIRSALPSYRKISHGIEYEQITSNQIKIIITSRILENYQEIFQGFALPKATFRIWVMGYKFKNA
jgi:hypothetical protein